MCSPSATAAQQAPQLTYDPQTSTTEAPSPTSLAGASDSVLQAAPRGLYTFDLNLSGQLQLAAQETDTIRETEDETIQTS